MIESHTVSENPLDGQVSLGRQAFSVTDRLSIANNRTWTPASVAFQTQTQNRIVLATQFPKSHLCQRRVFLFLLQEGSAESRFSSSYENFKANSSSQILPREVEMPLKKTPSHFCSPPREFGRFTCFETRTFPCNLSTVKPTVFAKAYFPVQKTRPV